MAVFKAHITTSPAGEVLDMFWLYDNRQQLPDHHRCANMFDSAARCCMRVRPCSQFAGCCRSSDCWSAGCTARRLAGRSYMQASYCQSWSIVRHSAVHPRLAIFSTHCETMPGARPSS